ncbi:oxidoreductase activity protein [[Candida] boidinii]|uniref:Unnamed protein product n=1 Tax=Candida boidinii TaxID=5477 RepID=A0ACB5TX66_CANBO|nr:oxidoreductase activity protein [[Candida] boidinii]OWB64187.1 oxidoreductase activity protein [[Candida] boidinii]OWB75385.1 oxidoreductase activity protein [[Candida] boidinii]GME96748.1 unnamed protein product [[Candida] boidinii]
MLKFCSRRSIKQRHISIRTIHGWKSKYGMIPMISSNEEFIDSNNDSHYTVSSPDNTEILHRASALSDINRINSISDNAMSGFKEWNQLAINEKCKIYDSIIKELHKNSKILIEAHKEIGIADWFAKFNVFGSIDNLTHYKSLLMTMNNGIIPVQHSSQHDLTMVLNQPIGPVLSISPWNAPGILTTRSILAPLTAGCSVIVKSSELSPLISYYIVKSFINGGLPKNVLHLIHSTKNDSEKIVSNLISNKNIRKINFTGSTETGSKISSIAGINLKPILLELGGKNCIVIENDYQDLEKALRQSLWSSWCHKGQICMCTDIIYINDKIYDKSIEIIKNLGKEFIQKDKDLMIYQRTLEHHGKISELVKDAELKGAKTIEFTDKTHKSFNPIVLENVTKDMDIYHTEIFGPVVSIIRYKDTDEIVGDINGLEYGLKCSIWTGNFAKGLQFAKDVESGSVHINNQTIVDEPHLPHGGVKNSGSGRFNSVWGIEEFSYKKLITVNS